MGSSKYRITEPHPSVPSSHYIHAGRGGAGNWTHIDPKNITSGSDATGPASRTSLNSAHAANSSHYYLSGRGGAGNLHHNERPIFSFDEELERQRRMMEHQTPVYHVGRGGAGNYASEGVERRSSAGSDTSVISGQAVRHSLEGIRNRLRGSFASKQ